MKKQKRKKRKNYNNRMDRRQIVKMIAAVFLLVITVTMGFSMCRNSEPAGGGEEVRGVWISYVDFEKLGLKDKSESEFRENAAAFLDRAEELHINTVFFHVRAFRDATYISDEFPISRYIWSSSEPVPYDPLEIMTEMTHDRNMAIHAWLNPYRNSSFDEEILDPGAEASTKEILRCVNEILDNYDVDGIHFDDYFYREDSPLETSEKMANVNSMIRQVYADVHAASGERVFGVSPAGNVSYCESLGADVRTWLSEEGYVDYIVPQIYWTDEHTATWRDKMFSDTLDEWISMDKNGVPIYVGLALYKTGDEDEADPGWVASDENIKYQIDILRERGCAGYVLFSASDLFRSGAAGELNNYLELEF